VRAHQQRRRRPHRPHVEAVRQVPHVGALERQDDRGVADQVLVALPGGAEPGVEIGGRRFDGEHPHVAGQAGVQRPHQRGGIVIARHANARHLSAGMDAGIGAPPPLHADRRAFERRKRVFEQALDGHALGLALPPDEPRAVVGERQLQGAGGQARDPGLTTGCPAAHSGQDSGG
jgi:hypothetical protein